MVDRHDGVRVGERRAVNGRGAGGAHAVEQPPAVELQDAGAHQRVGRQRVGAEARAVDERDAHAAAGQEHGGGCPATGRRRRPRRTIQIVKRCGACRFRSVKSGGGLEARALSGEQVAGDSHGVGADAVEEVGAARALEALPEHVQARHRA